MTNSIDPVVLIHLKHIPRLGFCRRLKAFSRIRGFLDPLFFNLIVINMTSWSLFTLYLSFRSLHDWFLFNLVWRYPWLNLRFDWSFYIYIGSYYLSFLAFVRTNTVLVLSQFLVFKLKIILLLRWLSNYCRLKIYVLLSFLFNRVMDILLARLNYIFLCLNCIKI